jgi:hypothetical protein
MDIIEFVAMRRIEEAIERGDFEGLPARGWIHYSVHGETFFATWWRDKIARETTQDDAGGE